jgi:hypothetical protein
MCSYVTSDDENGMQRECEHNELWCETQPHLKDTHINRMMKMKANS